MVPGASRNQIVGWLDDSLKVSVSTPPEAGKANKAVIRLLANTFDIKKNDIEILSGQTSPIKVVEIKSLSKVQVLTQLKTLR